MQLHVLDAYIREGALLCVTLYIQLHFLYACICVGRLSCVGPDTCSTCLYVGQHAAYDIIHVHSAYDVIACMYSVARFADSRKHTSADECMH